MKLAISNIAWAKDEEALIASKLSSLGVKYVEIAPTKIWDDPTVISESEAMKYVEWWAGYGISISAFQSMLFARPDLKLFESEQNRQETLEYMKRFIKLAGVMGVKRMVFGSPKNRQRGELSVTDANKISVDFFDKLGDVAKSCGVILCIEPNAPQYNCDYVTNAKEGIDLIRSVGNDGVGLHLDTACMALAGDNIGQSIHQSRGLLKYFHISSPMLEQVEQCDDVDHLLAAKSLMDIGYDGVVSIEMKADADGNNLARVERAIEFAKAAYLNR